MNDHFKELIATLEDKLKALQSLNDTIEIKLNTLYSEEHLKVEIWGRKWNLVLKGISGTLQETTAVTERAARDFMVNKFG
jgi:hypothetical protein